MNDSLKDNTKKVKKTLDIDIKVGEDKRGIYFIVGIFILLLVIIGGFLFLQNGNSEKAKIDSVYQKIKDGNTAGLESEIKAILDESPSDKTYLVAGAYYVQMGKWKDAIRYFELVNNKDLNTKVALLSAYAYNDQLAEASDLAEKLLPEIEKIKTDSENAYTAYYYYSIDGYMNEQYFLQYKNIDFLGKAIESYNKAILYSPDETLSNKISKLKSEYEKFGSN